MKVDTKRDYKELKGRQQLSPALYSQLNSHVIRDWQIEDLEARVDTLQEFVCNIVEVLVETGALTLDQANQALPYPFAEIELAGGSQ